MTFKYIKSNFTSLEFKFDRLDFSVSLNQYVTMCLHGLKLYEILCDKTREEQKLIKKNDCKSLKFYYTSKCYLITYSTFLNNTKSQNH